MPVIASVATVLPPRAVPQKEALEVFKRAYAGRDDLLKLLTLLERSGVETRHPAFPPEYYLTSRSFEERNRDYVEQGLRLAEQAARACLDKAGVRPEQVDHLFLVTTTGLATPSLDALMVPRLGLRPEVRRWPIFGLGCAGGAGALTRAADVLRGAPSQRALVVSVELCCQIFSLQALTPTDVLGAALFGDGAAAALVSGDATGAKGARMVQERTVLFPGTQHLMGWAFTSDGMRLVLSKEVADFVKERLRPVVDKFLSDASLRQDGIAHWILHPGGRKILDTYAATFGLPEKLLETSRRSLAKVGNLSSASVLFVLADVLDSGAVRPGDRGLMCALGPGFASELLLLGW